MAIGDGKLPRGLLCIDAGKFLAVDHRDKPASICACLTMDEDRFCAERRISTS